MAGKQGKSKKVVHASAGTKPYHVFDAITTKTVDAIGGGGKLAGVPDMTHKQLMGALGIAGNLVFAHGKPQDRQKKSH